MNAISSFPRSWKWDGANWVELSPPSHPSGRDGTSVYSASLGKVILFGGYDGTMHLNETWTFDGSTWTNVTPPSSPLARAGNGMAAVGAGAVIMGGYNIPGGYLSDTQYFDGTKWTKLRGPGPEARTLPNMTYDGAHHYVLLNSGTTDTVEYDDTWTLR